MDIHSSSNANVCTTYTNYDFSKVSLMHPESLHGGSGTFFTKIGIGIVNEALYIQTPKCITKQGVTTTAGKKAYIDLMFSSEDTSFIEFMENLEKSCIEKIHEKKNSWFTNDIDQSDIENAFTSALRPFKGGKYYSMRANIAPSKNLMKMPTCFVFDENEKKLTIDDIKQESDVISVLEIQGIKFTQRSFQFEIIIRQVLIMADKPVFQSCLIKKPIGAGALSTILPSTTNVHDSESSQHQEEYEGHEEHEEHEEHIVQQEEEQKDITDSLAVSHTIEKDVNMNISLNTTQPKPISNTLSSLASSILNKDKTPTIDLEKVEKVEKVEKDEKPREIVKPSEITEITEVDLEINDDEKIKIKKPNDIYYEIYKAAKEKARNARKLAFDAYLEVKKIKNTYMLDDSDSDTDYNSDSDSSTESGSDSEIENE
jgi:DNA/RNA endonuclease YhcR with UshA esterase domain